MKARVVLVLLLVSAVASAQQPSAVTCALAAECAQAAADAIARSEFEVAHDLAWRAVQLGTRNDPALMYLLARAQSLSGRPRDAVVMLRRLATLGFQADDIETLDDFRRVRSLPDGPDTLAAIRGVSAPASARTPAAASFGGTAPAAPAAPDVPAAPVASAAPGAPNAPGADGLPIPASVIAPLALAYDTVSDRFVVADESSDTLKVVDERTGRVLDLVSRGWAGTYRPSALAIDSRRGDLWAIGVDTTTSDTARSALYKLQLVSGRLLQTISLPTDAGPVHLVDVAIGRQALFLLDAAGRRVFSLAAGANRPRVIADLKTLVEPVSIAAAGDTVLYVAHANGLARVVVSARTRLPIPVPSTADVADLQAIRWHEGSLFAIQRHGAGHAAARIQLDARGTMATSVTTIGPAASRAAGVSAGVFYYVVSDSDGIGMLLRGTPAR